MTKTTILSTILMTTILLTFSTAQLASADVVSHIPGHAGDPGISTALTGLGMADNAASETTQTTFVVPGAGPINLTFTFEANGGAFTGSFGFYDVSTVTANPVTQKALYTSQALAGATEVFDDAVVNPGVAAAFNVLAGTQLGFFLIPDQSLATYIGNPAFFQVHGGNEDSPLFSVSDANPGEFDQLVSFADNGNNLFAWEDLTRTGASKIGASDNDFDDLIFSVDAILPPPIFEKTLKEEGDCFTQGNEVLVKQLVIQDCHFTIQYTGEPAVITDHVPAEWEVTGVMDDIDNNQCEVTTKKSGKSATKIDCGEQTHITVMVWLETRESPGKGHKTDVFKPTTCDPNFVVNDGAIATSVELDIEGNPVFVEQSNDLTINAEDLNDLDCDDVPNENDLCEDTPFGTPVDSDGCQLV